MTEIQNLKIQSLKSWVKQLKPIIKKNQTIDEKIAALEAEKQANQNQINAYNSLVESTFGSRCAGLAVNDLAKIEKFEGADIVVFNKEYIISEETKSTDKNGRVVTKTKYYFNDSETPVQTRDAEPVCAPSSETQNDRPENISTPMQEDTVNDPFASNDLVDSL